MGVRIRMTLGDIDPLNKFKRATSRVQKAPLLVPCWCYIKNDHF